MSTDNIKLIPDSEVQDVIEEMGLQQYENLRLVAACDLVREAGKFKKIFQHIHEIRQIEGCLPHHLYNHYRNPMIETLIAMAKKCLTEDQFKLWRKALKF